MKKLLLASTALVAFAGAAAAEVTISGSAEMGIAGGDIDGGDVNTVFFQSVDVRFAMTGESDSGLSFGATIDLEDIVDEGDDDDDGIVDDAGTFADYTVFISGAFGTLTMGDTDGALDWAITEVGNNGNPGSIADNETGHAGYLSNGVFDGGLGYNGQVLRYDYSFGAFGVAVSAQVDEDTTTDGDANLQLGLKYGLEFGSTSVDLGLGYSVVGDNNSSVAGDTGYDAVAVGAAATFAGGFSASVTYAQLNDDGALGGDGEHIGVGLGYETGPISVHANWGEYDWDATAGFQDSDGWGIAAAYDLGGGLSAHVGYGNSDFGDLNGVLPVDADADNSTWSLGMSMSF